MDDGYSLQLFGDGEYGYIKSEILSVGLKLYWYYVLDSKGNKHKRYDFNTEDIEYPNTPYHNKIYNFIEAKKRIIGHSIKFPNVKKTTFPDWYYED